MSTLTNTSTDSHAPTTPATKRSRWPLFGVAAGLLGIVGTLITDVRPDGKSADAMISPADMDNLSRGTYHVGIIAGYLCVAALLVMAAAWRRHVEQRFTDSTAARVVANGLIASAGALSLGYGWKGAMAVYLPGGMDHGAYPTDGLYVLYMLNDFGAYIGWLGTMVAAGAIASMAFREKTVSRWIGVVSCLLLLPVIVFVVATGLPGFPGVVGGLWLLVMSLGLTFGKSAVAR
jgi:hypothetical protein